MQNIQISISFHSITHNNENTKHMQTQKFKTLVIITDFLNKSQDTICVWLLNLISNDRVRMFGTAEHSSHIIYLSDTSMTSQKRKEAILDVIILATPCAENILAWRLKSDVSTIQLPATKTKN